LIVTVAVVPVAFKATPVIDTDSRTGALSEGGRISTGREVVIPPCVRKENCRWPAAAFGCTTNALCGASVTIDRMLLIGTVSLVVTVTPSGGVLTIPVRLLRPIPV
jgi:hypothetical protein